MIFGRMRGILNHVRMGVLNAEWHDYQCTDNSEFRRYFITCNLTKWREDTRYGPQIPLLGYSEVGNNPR